MLPRYLFGNSFSNASECVSQGSMTYQRVPYMDVACARWVGKAISVTRRGAAPYANVTPNPIKKLPRRQLVQSKRFSRHATGTYRAPMNIPTEWEVVWRMVATIMIDAPKAIAGRRPSPSVTYGEKGYAARAPMFCVSNGLDQWSPTLYILNIPTWIALSSPS